MSEHKDFLHFGLDPAILEAIQGMGYQVPTPIQSKGIPIVATGKDVMGAAQTGTGKTAGYGLPLLQRIIPKQTTSVSPARHPVRALIITPTRELAEQVAENLKQFASKTLLRVEAAYGGVDIKPQAEAIRRGVEVLICTPGRLLDHIEQKNVNLSQVEILVLDEADRMLDMGFLPDMIRIIKQIPANAQRLMFSATFSPEIKKLAQNFLNDPVIIEVARRNATAATIEQKVFKVHQSEKVDALVELLQKFGMADGKQQQAIVFVNAKITARRLARQLENFGFKADSIHGDKSQDERTKTLENFKKGEIDILVATDVAARGLDIAELPMVINYDPPFNAEDYVHRIGRTGRAGSSGLALMVMTGSDERLVEAIEVLTKQKFKREELHPKPAKRKVFKREYARESGQPYASRPHQDPLFSEPYVPKPKAVGVPSAAVAPAVAERKDKKKGTVAVLLGGTGRA